MSFILDALKKSEKERQREAVPGINDLPIVIHQTRTSTWMVAAVAALGIGVVVLVWAWWRNSVTGPIVASPAPVTPAPVVSTTPPPGPVPAEPQPLASTTTRSLANEAARMAAATTVTTPPATSATSTEPLIVQAAPAVITPSPMSILQARAAGLAVPELRLELLVYGPEPSQRFVFINASKYVEGETLADGPRLIEISPQGAILSYAGQNFLLPQE